MIELLAPAGSFEALEAAINAGADAIYVGGNRFNARAYATNFDIEELERAVKLCHRHGVRLFVTVNTLYQDEDFHDLYNYILALYEMQVDALIVQDEGLINCLHKSFPDFEIHASTQCTVHSLDGVQYYANKGVKRVVLARENSIDEIKYIIQHNLAEIEVFVHGALCVCYSGQCFMSAQNGGRSANKGQCAQPCRLTYQLKLNGQNLGKPTHLLSMADLCTIDHVSELIEAGVHSLKIEGRMKRPEYVYAVVSSYRKAIDAYYQKKSYQPNHEMLMQLFNRNFTSGYLFKQNKVVNNQFSGNQGILAAQVLSYDQKRHRLKMKALINLHQQDGIRIGNDDHGLLLNKIYVQNKLVNRVENGTIFEIDDSIKTKSGTKVYRTLDHQLEKETSLQLKDLYRRIPISMKLIGKIGHPLTLELKDDINQVRVNTNSLIENAKNAPLSIERIKTQCGKLGNTIYSLDKLEIDFPKNGFLSIKELNDLRRQALEQLDVQRSSIYLHASTPKKSFSCANENISSVTNDRFYIHVENIEQLEEVLQYPVHILFPLNAQFEKAFRLARDMNKELIGVVPTIVKDHEWKRYDQRIQSSKLNQLAISHPAALQRYGSLVTFGLPSLNLMNHSALSQYSFTVTLSMELSRSEVNSMLAKESNAIAFLYGHPESMRMDHCPVSYHYFQQKKPHCGQCKQGCFTLVDRKGAEFSLSFDEFCRTTIYYPQLRNWLDQPYRSGYLHFTSEDQTQVRKIMKLLNL